MTPEPSFAVELGVIIAWLACITIVSGLLALARRLWRRLTGRE